MKVLVAYETVNGSARSIAENIGRSLAAGYLVTTLPMREVVDLDGFDACVLGSAEVDEAWPPAAAEFLRRHADELAERPVWLFSVGNTDALPRPVRRMVRRREERALARVIPAGVYPVGTRLFSGMIRRDDLTRRSERLLLRAAGVHDRDFRRWHEIMDWAREIGSALEFRAVS